MVNNYRTLHTYFQIMGDHTLPREPGVAQEEAKKVLSTAVGVLFSYAVSTLEANYSPGMKRGDFSSARVNSQDHQKRMQGEARRFFRDRAKQVAMKEMTVLELTECCQPALSPTAYAPGSVEYMVATLNQEAKFEELGRAIMEGAEEYHHQAKRRGPTTDQRSREYLTLKDSLEKLLKPIKP